MARKHPAPGCIGSRSLAPPLSKGKLKHLGWGREVIFERNFYWITRKGQMEAEWQTQLMFTTWPYFKTRIPETHPFQLNFSEHAEVLKASTVSLPNILTISTHPLAISVPSAYDILSIINYSLYSALSAFHGGFGYWAQLHLLTSIL